MLNVIGIKPAGAMEFSGPDRQDGADAVSQVYA